MPNPRRLVLALALLAVAGCASQANQLDLEDEVSQLRAQVARLSAGTPPARVADEVPAPAPVAGAAPAPAASLDMTLALDQMRSELAELRGQVDDLAHRSTTATMDLESRMSRLEQKSGLPTPGPFAAPSPAPEAAPPASPADANRVILPGVVLPPRPGANDAGAVPPQIAFDLAMRDYKQSHFDLASVGFASFVEQYPESALTPEAYFWLGESYRSQGQSDRAIKAWATLIKTYPKHDLAPRAMLRTGETYKAADDVRAAEKVLKLLVASYPSRPEADRAKEILSELR